MTRGLRVATCDTLQNPAREEASLPSVAPGVPD